MNYERKIAHFRMGERNVLLSNQHAFRQFRSTGDCLFNIDDAIHSTISTKIARLSTTFIEISKAFDISWIKMFDGLLAS